MKSLRSHNAARIGATLLSTICGVNPGYGYAFKQIVPDVRQPAVISGGSACPVRSHQLTASGTITLRWSTVLGTNPVTMLTQNQTATGQLTEIEQVIAESMAAWTGVSGTSLLPAAVAPLARVASANACGADGLNSICFDQTDAAFTPGVLAFTRVITADVIGEQMGSAVSTELGQILDADIYFSRGNAQITFATPLALPSSRQSYDLESLLTHELGHLLGFSHSAVWNALMYPYAPTPGTYTGLRPTAQQADAPLGDDDRTGLRVLYPDASDTTNIGSIRGRILPANPLSLPQSPPGVTGVFGAHVLAVDSASGNVIAGTLAEWSCTAPGPVQFDGSYGIEHLPVNRSYSLYVEPLNGTVAPTQVSPAIVTVCRNGTNDAGWPLSQACVVPVADTSFTTRIR